MANFGGMRHNDSNKPEKVESTLNNGIAFIYDQYLCPTTDRNYLFAKNSDGASVTFVSELTQELIDDSKFGINTAWIKSTPACMVEWNGNTKNGIITEATFTRSSQQWIPRLSLASLDIETSCFDNTLYCIGVHFHGGEFELSRVFMLGTGEMIDDYIHYFSTEIDLLAAFQEWFIKIDPDIIVGWHIHEFDIKFIANRFEANSLPFILGRHQLPPPQDEEGKPRHIQRAPGRVIIDANELIDVLHIPTHGLSLEDVAQQFLGEGKLIKPSDDKVFEIERMYRDDRRSLGLYNLKDCELVTRLVHRLNLIPSILHLSRILNCQLSTLRSPVVAIDAMFHREMAPIAVQKPVIDDLSVFNPPPEFKLKTQRGHHESILELDLTNVVAVAARLVSIDPVAVASHFSLRMPPPTISDETLGLTTVEKNRINHYIDLAYERMIKFKGHRHYSTDVAERHRNVSLEIHKSIHYVLRKHHFFSVLFRSGKLWISTNHSQLSEETISILNAEITDNLSKKFILTDVFRLNISNYYDHVFIGGYSHDHPKLPDVFVGHGDGPEFTIYPVFSRDQNRSHPMFYSTVVSGLLSQLFSKQSIVDWIMDLLTQLHSGQLDHQLVISKRIKKSPKRYGKVAPPHIIAARKSKKFSGKISYVLSKTGPHPVSLLPTQIDYNLYVTTYLQPLFELIATAINLPIDTLPSPGQTGLF